MKIYLKHHWHAGGIREFDTETGAVGEKQTETVETNHWGFVWRQNSKWFAIRRDGDHLIFQHEKNIWPLTEPFRFQVTGVIIRKFSIVSGTAMEFEIRYKPSNSILQFFDPTYDAIDAESDDFFLYVCSMRDYYGKKGLGGFIKNQ